jgi:DNA-binding transcriptional LysR family regulator
MSISAVSKHIARLESDLSVKLLERSSRNLNATESGRVFYEHCVRILTSVELAKAEALGVSGEVSGILRIHSTPSVGSHFVAAATLDFAKAYSTLKVELTMGSLPVDPGNRGLDVIVTSGDSTDKDPRAYDSFVTRKLGAVPYIACASPEYLVKHGHPHNPEELRHRPCLIHLNAKQNPFQWEFKHAGHASTISVNGRYRSTSIAAVLAAAIEGLGIAIMPEYAVRAELDAGRLEAVLVDTVQSQRIVRVYYGRSRYVPRKVKAFVEFLRKRYQGRTLRAPNKHAPVQEHINFGSEKRRSPAEEGLTNEHVQESRAR